MFKKRLKCQTSPHSPSFFIYHLQGTSTLQYAGRVSHELSKYDLRSPRVSQQLSGYSVRPVYVRSWVRFLSGTQIFSLSHARDMLIIPSFFISLTILSLGWGNKCLPPEFFTFPKIFLEAIWCDRVTSLFVSGWKKNYDVNLRRLGRRLLLRPL